MTPATAVDLGAYFQRIGYTGPHAPSIETLRAIHLRHTEAIAFENLNPLMGWPVQLDLESLQQKMVRDGRGGYCFEHNLLFQSVLESLGFCVRGLAARVLWNTHEGIVSPRTHMLLRVDLDEQPYIVDVGFGGVTLTGPLRLSADLKQSTPHEPFRLVKYGDEFIEQVQIRNAWISLYRFDLSEQLLPDYEMANWYISTQPASRFVTGLIATRPASDRRYALRNNQLTVHHRNGTTEREVITSVAAVRETLEQTFGVRLPDTPNLDAALARVIAQGV